MLRSAAAAAAVGGPSSGAPTSEGTFAVGSGSNKDTKVGVPTDNILDNWTQADAKRGATTPVNKQRVRLRSSLVASPIDREKCAQNTSVDKVGGSAKGGGGASKMMSRIGGGVSARRSLRTPVF